MTYDELCEAILTAQEEMLKCKVEANSITLNGKKYGKLIENCPPNMKPTIFGMAVKADYALPDDYDFLVQYEPSQPQTNYDRLISKTPEELAIICEDGCPPHYGCPPIKREEMGLRSVCQKCWLDWLKAPAEEGDG